MLLPALPAAGRGPDDPFYEWDLERYRLLRPADAPSGSILPIPDSARAALPLRSESHRIEIADPPAPVAATEQDGRRIRRGVRLRSQLDLLLAPAPSLRIGLAGRFLLGDGRRSGGEWMERNLAVAGRRLEARIGLTRSFWGLGRSGSLLLGRTAPPLEQIQLRTVQPLELPWAGPAGRLQGSIFLAYLDDRHRKIPYPLLQGTRIEWEPTDWFLFAASRTILLGGVGRTEKLRPRDLWDIWWGRNENLRGERPPSDTDQKASFSAQLRLPPRAGSRVGIEGGRFFYEYAGEDAFKGLLPTAVAHHMGGSLCVSGWILSCEFAETTDDANYWYVYHTVYGSRPYYHRGYVLGHGIEADARLGTFRLEAPDLGGFRAQAWIRSLGHWDRETETTPWWEDAVGLLIRRDLPSGAVAEVGGEVGWSRGDLDPLPDPSLPWRIELGIRSAGRAVSRSAERVR